MLAPDRARPYPAGPMETSPPVGFLWSDFFVEDTQTPLAVNPGRGFVFGKPVTEAWLAEVGIAAVLRAHQHNDAPSTGPMLRTLKHRGGIVDNWAEAGLVFTFLSGTECPGFEFHHDSFGLLRLDGPDVRHWRLRHCRHHTEPQWLKYGGGWVGSHENRKLRRRAEDGVAEQPADEVAPESEGPFAVLLDDDEDGPEQWPELPSPRAATEAAEAAAGEEEENPTTSTKEKEEHKEEDGDGGDEGEASRRASSRGASTTTVAAMGASWARELAPTAREEAWVRALSPAVVHTCDPRHSFQCVDVPFAPHQGRALDSRVSRVLNEALETAHHGRHAPRVVETDDPGPSAAAPIEGRRNETWSVRVLHPARHADVFLLRGSRHRPTATSHSRRPAASGVQPPPEPGATAPTLDTVAVSVVVSVVRTQNQTAVAAEEHDGGPGSVCLSLYRWRDASLSLRLDGMVVPASMATGLSDAHVPAPSLLRAPECTPLRHRGATADAADHVEEFQLSSVPLGLFGVAVDVTDAQGRVAVGTSVFEVRRDWVR